MSEIMLEKSLKNCHVRGLHSIVLSEGHDGRLTRMFIHEPKGGLSFGTIPIAAHSHRRDLRFTVLTGVLQNTVVEQSDDPLDTCEAKLFKWVTPIGNESGGHFERLPGTVRPRISMTSGVYYPGREFSMKAAEMHEVACKDDQWTCWLIDEGDMDPNYQPIVWSLVDDLDQWKPTGLYEKFTGVPEIRKLMKDAGIQHFDLGER